jgi:predicted DNA-binding transcriptional regulator AlpA
MSDTDAKAYSDAKAYTIPEFCKAHRISRSGLYQCWARGTGPRIKRIGSKVIITAEAAAAWRAADEAAA